MFCWPCITVYQYSETNMMHFLSNLLRTKGLCVSSITCSPLGSTSQAAFGILRACYVSWLHLYILQDTIRGADVNTANRRIARLIRSEKSSRNTKTRKVINIIFPPVLQLFFVSYTCNHLCVFVMFDYLIISCCTVWSKILCTWW
jgi:hypothetical protein